ncbi:MAG TPA: peptidyl-alpha-hydroxyglycine alpha-amidating lyase family protein [Vicinamibacterales bacterium]|nr:peptidyl-alpha-hydroxyglycine alpha-amidating lyase family protein [Vicinamibacterales bacterium]
MNKWLIAAIVALGPTIFAQPSAVSEIPFDSTPNFLKLPPDMNLGEASGVAVNSKGDIAVFTRSNSAGGPAYGATASQILLFDKAGKFVREVGKGLYAWSYAHAVRYDRDDNLWAIDKGSDMIVRINPEGHVTMVFGRKKEASDEAAPWTRVNPPRPPVPGQFRQPTDVAWDADGAIYISDGYINSRIAKFTKDGDWVMSMGEPGGGKLGNLNTPHSIANDAKGNIYVADRGNRRIQVIDPKTNTFVREIKVDVAQAPVPADAKPWMGATPNYAAALAADAPPGAATMAPGSPWAVCISGGPTQYIYFADAFPGRVYKLTLDGKLVGYFGKSGHQLKQFGWIHEIACPSENELYVAELLNWRVQKLTLHPAQARTSTAADR